MSSQHLRLHRESGISKMTVSVKLCMWQFVDTTGLRSLYQGFWVFRLALHTTNYITLGARREKELVWRGDPNQPTETCRVLVLVWHLI